MVIGARPPFRSVSLRLGLDSRDWHGVLEHDNLDTTVRLGVQRNIHHQCLTDLTRPTARGGRHPGSITAYNACNRAEPPTRDRRDGHPGGGSRPIVHGQVGSTGVCRRHGRPRRPRQVDAGQGADRHRPRPPARGEGAGDDDRPRLRLADAAERAARSASSTCPATSASSRTCWPASAASTPPCSSSPPTRARCRRRPSTWRSSICSASSAALVVLTKADLVDDDWLELVERGGRASDSPARRWPARRSSPVSALTGAGPAGAARQRSTGCSPTAAPPADAGRPRLPIDRVFTVAGFGTVVTGTLIGGSLRLGDEVEIQPGGRTRPRPRAAEPPAQGRRRRCRAAASPST